MVRAVGFVLKTQHFLFHATLCPQVKCPPGLCDKISDLFLMVLRERQRFLLNEIDERPSDKRWIGEDKADNFELGSVWFGDCRLRYYLLIL